MLPTPRPRIVPETGVSRSRRLQAGDVKPFLGHTTSTRPRARSATAAASRAARSRAAIPAPTSDCWPRSTRCTARCPVRPRTSCAPAPSISSATVASNGWPPSPTGTCTTCGRRQAINDAAGRYQPDAAGTSRHRRTPPPAALRTTRLDTGRYRASRRSGQQLAGFPPNTNSGRARPRRRSPVGFRVSWLLWNDLLSTLMRSSTPVAPERRAPSAISPRVGRRNDERSKGASTTSHAAIR